MLQNLKVDIIYHLTNSDFEMEFNLCGCCRMRLLSDKTADKKALVAALSRAVGRSRIIIACGPLFSADGLIATVATAIGSRVSPVDNAAYGINGGDTIEIIAGSTPLVTAEGYFGGCIIESGPQTIILLTENKALRKSLMQTLIHPYIEEMSMLPVKSKAVPQEISEETIEAETEEESVDVPEAEETAPETVFLPATVEIVDEVLEEETEDTEPEEETEELQEYDIEEPMEQESEEDVAIAEELEDEAEQAEEQEDADDEQELEEETPAEESAPELEYIADTDESGEREIPFVFDEEEQKQMQELSNKMSEAYGTMYVEPERVKHSHTDKYAASYTPTEENDSFLSDADYVSYKKSLYRKNLNVPIIILAVVLLLIIGVLGYFLVLQPRLQGVDTIEYLREIFDTVDRTVYV